MAGWDEGLRDAVVTAAAAASDASRWREVLAALARRFGATAAALHTPGAPSPERSLFAQVGLPEDSLATYVAHWATQDPWFAGADARGIADRTGFCGVGREMCDWTALDRLPFYNEFAKPSGVRGLAFLVLDDGSQSVRSPFALLSLYRAPGLDEFSFADRDALRSVHGPLQLALHAHWAFDRTRSDRRMAVDALAATPKPLCVLATDGRLLHANPLGAALLSRSGWIATAQGGRIVRVGGSDAQAFQAALRCAAAGMAQVLPAWMAEAAPVPARIALARLVPLGEDNACRSAWPQARVLLMLDMPEPDRPQRHLRAIAERYRLTAAEARLLAHLADGASAAEISARLEVSVHTVRAHLRHLFDKTGARRQSDLVRLFLAGTEVSRPWP